MNLIEQFGSYEKAKEQLNELQDAPKDAYSWSRLIQGENIKQALLEYRRENNIFEVGDLVVLPYTNYRSDVFELTEGYRDVYDEKGICYRHATSEEIKAGKRL